jgi:hypothetical protein
MLGGLLQYQMFTADPKHTGFQAVFLGLPNSQFQSTIAFSSLGTAETERWA